MSTRAGDPRGPDAPADTPADTPARAPADTPTDAPAATIAALQAQTRWLIAQNQALREELARLEAELAQLTRAQPPGADPDKGPETAPDDTG